MQRIIEYIAGFIVLLLVQIFIFDNISITGYVNVYIYIMFIIMLPMQMRRTTVIVLGFLTGAIMDALIGSGGLCMMVTTWIAFIRSSILYITAGRDVVNIGGIPSARTIGTVRFCSYLVLMTLAYNIPFFFMETMNPSEIAYTTMRVIFSTIPTVLIIYFAHLIFNRTIK